MQGLQRLALRRRPNFLAVLVALHFSALSANALAGSSAAIEDAFTKSNRPNSNYGGWSKVVTRDWSDYTIFAKFDKSAMPSKIDSAKLVLNVYRIDDGGRIYVHPVRGDWSQTKVTHNNRPAFGSSLASFDVNTSMSGETIAVDVTRLVKDMVARGDNSIAFTTSKASAQFGSREGGAPIRLEINGSSSGGDSSSGGGGSSGGGSGSGNEAPSISGNPPGLVNAGSSYDFRPRVSDPDGDDVSCSIENRPSWANFSSGNCRLYGTPSDGDVGVHGRISITVTDGEDSATLGPFDIEVGEGGNSSVTLTWQIPTRNTDGSMLRDLDSFRIDWSRRNSSATGSIDVSNPSVSTYVIENLSPGTYEFSIVAINDDGVSSSSSNRVTATID